MAATLFRVPGPVDESTLRTMLGGRYLVVTSASFSTETAYLDTFDWRLYNKGMALLQAGHELTLARLAGSKDPIHQQLAQRPAFAWDVPTGQLRNRLQAAAEMRALLPRVQLSSHVTLFALLNEDEKTVLRLASETFSLPTGDAAVEAVVRLSPLRGYEGDGEDVAARLAAAGAKAIGFDELYRALMQAAGERPGMYQPKPVVPLSPEMRTDAALKALLKAELEVIRINEPYIPQDIDTEFLHDYRVALRRTRSALAEVKQVFPAETTTRFRADLRTANQVSNDLRDLDVYLLTEGVYREMLPQQLQEGIGPLFDHLRSRRAAALRATVTSLASPEYRAIMDAWAAFLNRPVPRAVRTPNGGQPVLEVANRRIYRQYRELLKDGRAITAQSPDPMLHALRIECKKLRYLLELFSGLYEPAEINALIRQLRDLQTNLGDFNDLSVQEAYLMRTAEEMARRQTSSADTLMAIGALVAALDARRKQVRAQFAETFAEFATKANRHRFKQVVREPAEEQEAV